MSEGRNGIAGQRGRPVAVGLCGGCVHARRVVSDRGSAFLLCGRAATERRFARYPQLPVLRCPGFEAPTPGDGPSGIDTACGPGLPG